MIDKSQHQSIETASRILRSCDELCEAALGSELEILAHLLSLAMLQASKDMAAASEADRLSEAKIRKALRA